MNDFRIGCVADDFTGASDIASFFQQGGMNCLLVNGMPENDFCLPSDCEAVVIALKCRSIDPEHAVELTQGAFAWLAEKGAKTLYYKYCSTFDSTPHGNIGPVLDNMLDLLDLSYTILCPALPVNGRTVREGNLYVDGVLLEQSSMRHHPLNPMLHSSIPILMEEQSKYPCYVLDREMLYKDAPQIFAQIEKWRSKTPRFYISVDYCDENDGRRIAALFGEQRLMSGGSALAAHLGKKRNRATGFGKTARRMPAGRTLILSGSCSQATCAQIEAFLKDGGKGMWVDPFRVLDGSWKADDFWRFADEYPGQDVLLYSSQGPERRYAGDADVQCRISAALEGLMANLVRGAVEQGMQNLIVAGGETAGAVMQGLGWKSFRVGDSVAPGVPMLFPLEKPEMCLVLKSGNFGQADFFDRAVEMMCKYG